ncbi:MAG: general secretion pathway protein GspB [Desulfuromonadales bacterium]|nr:general secretion pathway protein GspB [Desulfuromonadales bacterium]
MSFILEALKKSENKRRGKSGQSSPTIHELVSPRRGKSRGWVVAVVLLLAVNSAILLWFYGTNTQVRTTKVELSPLVSATTVIRKPTPVAVVVEKKRSPDVSPVVNTALPVLRSESKIYSISQLPGAIKNRLPTMKMALHAFNRENSNASLVQLNDRILREGDEVASHLVLEQITADGVVLHYDGYRFLVPRRKI